MYCKKIGYIENHDFLKVCIQIVKQAGLETIISWKQKVSNKVIFYDKKKLNIWSWYRKKYGGMKS